VEVALQPGPCPVDSTIISIVTTVLRQAYEHLQSGFWVPETVWSEVRLLRDNITGIYVAEAGEFIVLRTALTAGDGDRSVWLADADLQVHVYCPMSNEPMQLGKDGLEDRDNLDDEEQTSTAMVHTLPSLQFESLWDK